MFLHHNYYLNNSSNLFYQYMNSLVSYFKIYPFNFNILAYNCRMRLLLFDPENYFFNIIINLLVLKKNSHFKSWCHNHRIYKNNNYFSKKNNLFKNIIDYYHSYCDIFLLSFFQAFPLISMKN